MRTIKITSPNAYEFRRIMPYVRGEIANYKGRITSIDRKRRIIIYEYKQPEFTGDLSFMGRLD